MDNIDFNRYRIAKLCYTLDNPFPLKIPTVEFLNFKFSNNNNLKFCIDIETPWMPTIFNIIPEFTNKVGIKQCIKNNCVQQFKDVKVHDSTEKQDCVKSCYQSTDPIILEYFLFPLWSIRKKDPFGVVGVGLTFVRFLVNNLDTIIGEFDPLIDMMMGYMVDTIGLIPGVGDEITFAYTTVEDLIKGLRDNIVPWIDGYINIIDRNFEDGFYRFATTIPEYTKIAALSETTGKLLNQVLPFVNIALDQIDNLTSNLSGKTAGTSSTTTNSIMSELENLENEHDLWRWYTQIYLIEILEPPGGLIHL